MACGEQGVGSSRCSQMWVIGVSFLPVQLHPRGKCLWCPGGGGGLSPKSGVVFLEKIKNLLPLYWERNLLLGLSFFCLVTALTELSRLSALLKATTLLGHSE